MTNRGARRFINRQCIDGQGRDAKNVSMRTMSRWRSCGFERETRERNCHSSITAKQVNYNVSSFGSFDPLTCSQEPGEAGIVLQHFSTVRQGARTWSPGPARQGSDRSWNIVDNPVPKSTHSRCIGIVAWILDMLEY